MEIPADRERVPEAVSFLLEKLERIRKVSGKQAMLTTMVAEDLLFSVIERSAPGKKLTIKVQNHLWNVSVSISYTGESFRGGFADPEFSWEDDPSGVEAAESAVRRAYKDRIFFRYRSGRGVVTLNVFRSEYAQLYKTLICLVCGIAAGLLLSRLPEQAADFFAMKVFDTGYTLFLNALKMVVGPLVFFSICCSVSGFGDLRAVGRIGGKVFGSFLVTSSAAILIAFGMYRLLPVGNPSLPGMLGNVGAGTTAEVTEVSLSDMIRGLIPDNLFNMFADAQMLQIVVVSVLFGAAVTLMGNRSLRVRDGMETINELLSRVTSVIIRFMPAAVFCSMAKLTLTVGLSVMLPLLSMIGLIYLTDFVILACFGGLIGVCARLNPLVFYRKFLPAMLNAYSFGSSNAVLPISMKLATERLGIDRKLAAFSLPLGATVNMNGSCVTMVITVLFMAKTFGISLTVPALLSLGVTILTLSIGAPGVPGGCLICITMLLPQAGVPIEAVGLIVPLYSILGAILTTVNCTGDAVVTLIVAKRENMLDRKKYEE